MQYKVFNDCNFDVVLGGAVAKIVVLVGKGAAIKNADIDSAHAGFTGVFWWPYAILS